MKKFSTDPVIKFFISVLGLFVIFFLLKELQHIFIPFVIAYILFFFFQPLNHFLEKNKFPSGVIIFIDIVLTIILFYGISKGVVDSIAQFTKQLPLFEQKLNKIVSDTAVSIGITDLTFTKFNISELLKKIDYSAIAGGLFSSTVSVFTSIFLALFFFIFISSGHNKIVEAIRLRYVEKGVKSSIKKLKKEQKSKSDIEDSHPFEDDFQTLTIQRELKLKRTFMDITEQIQKYIVTKFIISVTLGIIIGLILWLFNVKFFVIWAALAVILNFIPNVGSVISVSLPVLMVLVQYESFSYALLIAAIIIVVQNIIGNILEPKIFGHRLGLNPLVILISLLVWGYLWGIVGMFLSVPLTAVLKIIISNSSSKNMRFISNLMNN